MPVSVSPTVARASAPTPTPAAAAPLPGDPVCVAFAGSADGFRHAGTRSLAVGLAPLLAAASATAPVADAPLAA
ncbi:hypothetical protein [Clavibacter michiganensis]|uniref:hypothetical protein n=1 Tax=Clavibacter michiganensis TaxID=28447 RepID=UPI001D8375FD|nr:hypothetical protein [Clavibacter michiganensis]MWI99492.1 hypothetical protein [Clavibacter michiganensis subsp. michiganensis]MDO4018579.1 hypothetical protein [Clavibacter michiganensis]MDO4037867.1 hypothetical protein [Clavibacter michiganensis]MDO4107985.1 hypothetical protein [Clavibacter michiganensis]MWJ13980.1 hypothetical protein [Clavibacter michiganensis subsp. michiganensis]